MAVGQGWVPGASGVPVEEALATLAGRGARTFIVTAIERDGLLAGPNLALLGRMVELGRGEIIASGGVSSLGDIVAVRGSAAPARSSAAPSTKAASTSPRRFG